MAPLVTTQYTVAISAEEGCSNTSNAVTVNVLPPPPAWVNAATQENRSVHVTWASVSGAIGYQVERRSPSGTFYTATDGTSWLDTVPPSDQPVTYVYTIYAVDEANAVSSGRSDDATAATVLYQQPHLVPGVTFIRAVDIAELRRGVDALRASYGLSPAFAGAYEPAGIIYAAEFTALVAALDDARRVIGLPPFSYTRILAPRSGDVVLGAHLQQLREALH